MPEDSKENSGNSSVDLLGEAMISETYQCSNHESIRISNNWSKKNKKSVSWTASLRWILSNIGKSWDYIYSEYKYNVSLKNPRHGKAFWSQLTYFINNLKNGEEYNIWQLNKTVFLKDGILCEKKMERRKYERKISCYRFENNTLVPVYSYPWDTSSNRSEYYIEVFMRPYLKKENVGKKFIFFYKINNCWFKESREIISRYEVLRGNIIITKNNKKQLSKKEVKRLNLDSLSIF